MQVLYNHNQIEFNQFIALKELYNKNLKQERPMELQLLKKNLHYLHNNQSQWPRTKRMMKIYKRTMMNHYRKEMMMLMERRIQLSKYMRMVKLMMFKIYKKMMKKVLIQQ